MCTFLAVFLHLAYASYRAVLDATMNFGAHAKFVHKELDKLDAEEKKDEAPAIDEPVAEPAPATEATTPARATEEPEAVPTAA